VRTGGASSLPNPARFLRSTVMGCGSSKHKTHPEREENVNLGMDSQNKTSSGRNAVGTGRAGMGGGLSSGSFHTAGSSSSTGNHSVRIDTSQLSASNSPGRRQSVRPTMWKKGELIGAGAYGRVYMGMNEASGSLIAVKEMVFAPDNFKEMTALQLEVGLMREFAHPNIVAYLGTELGDSNTLYIFTEWVPGGSLQNLLKKFGRFSESVVLSYTSQILLGLGYLHDNGIVHRDIKGSNILVDDRGNVKLCDFGASKRIVQTNAGNTVQEDNISLRGTPYFMAPEVITQTGHGRKADVWSVGCTVLQMASGLPPWRSMNFNSISALMFHIANTNDAPAMPDDISQELRSFMNVCFLREPAKRPSIAELQKHPFVTSDGDTKSWEMTINGGETADLLKEMIANTPSPLKKKRPGDDVSDPAKSGTILSDMSLSQNDFEEFDINEFTLPPQASGEKINSFLVRQASLERSRGSELGTPLNSPAAGSSNPYARGNNHVPNWETSGGIDQGGQGMSKTDDVVGDLPQIEAGRESAEDSMTNSWVESQNRAINTSHAVEDREAWQAHQAKLEEQKRQERLAWEEELEREKRYQEELRKKKAAEIVY
jgi:serine/threonine protein kinase